MAFPIGNLFSFNISLSARAPQVHALPQDCSGCDQRVTRFEEVVICAVLWYPGREGALCIPALGFLPPFLQDALNVWVLQLFPLTADVLPCCIFVFAALCNEMCRCRSGSSSTASETNPV